jgi:hypothetical protein
LLIDPRMLEKYEKAWNFGVKKRKRDKTQSESDTSGNESDVPEVEDTTAKNKTTLAAHMRRPLESQEYLLLLCLILLIAIFLFIFLNPDLIENPLKEDKYNQKETLPETEPDSLYENLQQNY